MYTKNNWKKIILRDLCGNIQYGYTSSSSEEQIGPNFLRITDIAPDFIDWDSVPYCEIDNNKISKYLLKKDDIIIARTGATVGYAKQIKEDNYAIFASYLVRLQLIDDINKKYIGYIVQSDDYKIFIKLNASGAAQPNANAQILTSYPLSLPPLNIQDKIVEILSPIDDLVEVNLRRIRVLEELAQSLYDEWFVNLRFLGYEDTEITQTEHGPTPKGWNWDKLGNALVLAYGKALKKSKRIPGKYPVFGSSGIIGSHDHYLVKGPTIIVGRKGNVGSVYWSDENCYPIDTVFYVETNVSLHYLFYNFQNQNFINSDAAVPGLSRNQAYTLPLLIPSKEILIRYEKLIDPFFQDLKIITQQNTKLREIRDALLPKLISGEIDISELNIAV